MSPFEQQIYADLIRLAASIAGRANMPPVFVDDWHFCKTTPKKDIRRVLQQAVKADEQCADWAYELRQLANARATNDDYYREFERQNEKLTAENGRLRDEIKKIEILSSIATDFVQTKRLTEIHAIAQAALKEAQDGLASQKEGGRDELE